MSPGLETRHSSLAGSVRTTSATSNLRLRAASCSGFTPGSQQSGFGEQAGSRVATVTTSADGTARVKICTATYSVEDRGTIPRNGTWTMAVTSNGVTTTFTYSYQVIDRPPLGG